MKALIAILIAVVLLGIPVVMFVSAANYGNSAEQTIEGQVKNNQTTLSNMTNQVIEVAKVPGMYAKDLKEIIQAALEGRYGADGIGDGGPLLVAITEAYPGQTDPQLYRNIQTVISAKRDEFAADQRALIDRVRAYKTKLGAIPDKWFLGWAGYPQIDLTAAKYNPIISASTVEAFQTGIDGGIKF